MDKHEILQTLSDKEKELLLNIVQHRAITRKELSSMLSLPPGTLYRMVESLIDLNIVETEKDTETAKVGRPNDIIKLNPMYGYFCSICIRRFRYHVTILDFSGRIIAHQHFSCDENTTPNEVKTTCFNAFSELIKEHSIAESDIICTTIASFNTPKEYYVKEKIHPGFFWSDVNDIAEYFAAVFPSHVFFGNTAIANACSCYYSSFFPDYRNLAYIILDEGIGCGYIVDKQIPRYSMRNVNGLGHMIVDIHGPRCYCGQYGCLESIVNDYAILEKYKDVSKVRGTPHESQADEFGILELCEASNNGDNTARSAMEYAASVLAIGISNLLKLLQLQVIVISGKMISNSECFLSTIEQKLKSQYPNLMICVDDKEWEHSVTGISEWYMNEVLSLTPLPNLIIRR